MSILKLTDLDISDVGVETEDTSFESSILAPGRFENLFEEQFKITNAVALRDRIVERGSICRTDAEDLKQIADVHPDIQTYVNETPTAFYTEALSDVNFDDTVEALENGIAKSMMSTIGDMANHISTRATSAMKYVTDAFDDETITNKNALRVMIMVEYATTISNIVGKSKSGRDLSKGINQLIDKSLDEMASEWDGLKALVNNSKSDLRGLVESVSSPIISYYPDVLKNIIDVMEGLEKAKSKEDVSKLMKSITVPNVAYGRLSEWIKKYKPGVKFKPAGEDTLFQTVAVYVRNTVQSLSKDRQVHFDIKADTFLKSSEYIPLMSSQVTTERELKKAKDITSKYTGDLNKLGKMAQRLVLADNYEADAMPIILEVLSLVRGFNALEETLGMLTIARRELINVYLTTLSDISRNLHLFVKSHTGELTIAEVKSINDATIKLKSNLSEV